MKDNGDSYERYIGAYRDFIQSQMLREATKGGDVLPMRKPIKKGIPSLEERAKGLVANERQTDYGHPKDNAQRVALIWSAVLGAEVLPSEVGLCLIGLKLARLIETPNHDDSMVDLIGYIEYLKIVVEEDTLDNPESSE